MITPRPLDSLDPVAVQEVQAEVLSRVQADAPRLDLRRGVLAELLVYYHAVLDTQRAANIQDYLKARSLSAIAADPTLADPDLVDAAASNFRVSRGPGRAATGTVTVVVSDDTTVTIPSGSVWRARGRVFAADRGYTAKAESAQVSAVEDRLLTPLANGTWAFQIEVTAADTGPEYDVGKDELVTPDLPPTNYVTSYATADFAPGLAAETNAELLARLREGIAAKALSNRVNMSASLKSVDQFSRITASSIVGHGDAELVRAYHSVLPVALGNRCDWYVRTQARAAKTAVTATATLVAKRTDGTGEWRFSFGRNDYPGFYEFTDIRPEVTPEAYLGSYVTLDDVRGFDVTGTGFVPDVVNEVEAAFSAYATALITFHDPDTDVTALALGASKFYSVTVVGLPLVSEIQGYVGSRDVRNFGGDCLVKAPVPCFTRISFTVFKRTGQADPDLDAIRAGVADAVNTLGFTGTLYSSTITEAAYKFLADGQSASAVDMVGRLRRPDNTVTYLRDAEKLVVPNTPGDMVTRRTVAFFCDPAEVGVTVVTVPGADS